MIPDPPKPPAREGKLSLWRYMRLFRADILSAQPARLYRAWMAEFRTPFFRSYLSNDPQIVDVVLKKRPDDFPKSPRIREGLAPLLGNSVFVSTGAQWQAQRRIIDPAFAGGRLRDSLPAFWQAGLSLQDRLMKFDGQVIDIEPEASHAAADVIFRALFSIPIEHDLARAVFDRFRAYQRAQPLLNLAAFLPLPAWFPRPHRARTRAAARAIRAVIATLVEEKHQDLARGCGQGDLAAKIMTTPDPQTGACFSRAEMVDQVAIFFLAGHETSAAVFGWFLYLLSQDQDVQGRAAAEAMALPENPSIADIYKMIFIKDCLRETLRLYPPVPMMVRQSTRPEIFRGRKIRPGAQVVISPWHLQRHQRLWPDADAFDPDRWARAPQDLPVPQAYLPFSAGPRACPGAGFAMVELAVLAALVLRRFHLEPAPGAPPVPVAHLTLRGRDGIRLGLRARGPGPS